MHVLDEGKSLLEKLEANSALLDARLIGLNLFEDPNGGRGDEPTLHLDFYPRKGTFENKLRLVLKGVKEFNFYYDNRITFFYIVKYKLFQLPNGDFYVSLDPFDEGKTVCEDDCGVIRATNISGVLLDDPCEA
jgi:hypothetical protein